MIYFVQPPDGGPIKIGCSANVRARVSSLQSHYGRRLAILSTMEGGPEQERVLHDRFAHLRFRIIGRHGRPGHPEQFRPGPELTTFLEIDPVVDWRNVEPIIPRWNRANCKPVASMRIMEEHPTTSQGNPVILDDAGNVVDYPIGVMMVRRALGIIHHQLAAECGVPVSTIRHWETGRRMVPAESLNVMADLLAKRKSPDHS